MLKQGKGGIGKSAVAPAAFGRLCVETPTISFNLRHFAPAAFGRLCVETRLGNATHLFESPAAFGRLCVETPYRPVTVTFLPSSRLRAAVC